MKYNSSFQDTLSAIPRTDTVTRTVLKRLWAAIPSSRHPIATWCLKLGIQHITIEWDSDNGDEGTNLVLIKTPHILP